MGLPACLPRHGLSFPIQFVPVPTKPYGFCGRKAPWKKKRRKGYLWNCTPLHIHAIASARNHTQSHLPPSSSRDVISQGALLPLSEGKTMFSQKQQNKTKTQHKHSDDDDNKYVLELGRSAAGDDGLTFLFQFGSQRCLAQIVCFTRFCFSSPPILSHWQKMKRHSLPVWLQSPPTFLYGIPWRLGWVLLYIHRNRMFVREPRRPLRLSHSSWALSPKAFCAPTFLLYTPLSLTHHW